MVDGYSDGNKDLKKIVRYSLFGLAGLTTIILGLRSCTTIPPGHVGVRTLFGDVREHEFDDGLHLKNPLERVIKLDGRTQEVKETMQVPTSEGLLPELEVSVLYHIDPNEADDLYRTLGDIERQKISFIEPNIRSISREVVSGYKAEDLYTQNRERVTASLSEKLQSKFVERNFIFEASMLRNVKLPEKLAGSIEQKLQAEQEAQKMQFVLQKEQQEADRKRIEARGIADANQIIANSLTESYLKWYWIDNLGKHEDVIYVPIGPDGMPFFKEIK